MTFIWCISRGSFCLRLQPWILGRLRIGVVISRIICFIVISFIVLIVSEVFILGLSQGLKAHLLIYIAGGLQLLRDGTHHDIVVFDGS